MKVVHILLSYWLLVLLLCPGDVTRQFTAAPPTCPGDTFTFRCTVIGNISGETTWRVGGSSECILVHGSTSSSVCGPSNDFTARAETGFGPGTTATSFSSTLSGTATPALNGTLVECFGPASNVDQGNRVGSSILYSIGPPSVSTLSCAKLSGDVSGNVNVTVSWTLSGGDSADFYLINITTNAPQTPHGGLLNITTASVTQHELTGFIAGYEYNITVRGVDCGSQEGGESEPLTIRPQVPTTPVLDVCPVYDMVNETLQIIESNWTEVNNVTVSEVCANGRDIRASYELYYTTVSGTLITTCVVNGTECSNGRCHHELQNNTTDSRCQPPEPQFSGKGVTVSVTARNIVGRSNSAVSRSINGRNIDLEASIDTTNLSNAFVECTFFQPGYTSTIVYGTDPSYTNLVYRNTSYTQGRQTTITLSQQLRGDTTYYYIVSAESNSQCVRVQGRFQTGCSKTDLIHESGTTNPTRCIERGFVNSSSITDGVVCYNGTAVGSRAVYICNDGYNLIEGDKATRVCQSDGSWNGSIPQCIPKEGDQTRQIVGGVVGSGVLLIAVGAIIIIIIILHQRYRLKPPREVFGITMKLIDNTGTDTSIDGRTPLHNAAEQGDVDTLKDLLGKGININIEDKDGRTPLHIAAEQSDANTVKTLLVEGSDTNIKDKDGMTPLHVAAERGHLEIVRCLVAVEGAPINIEDKNGWTPLHIAVREGQEVTVEILVDNGADLKICDKHGMTPLHLAAKKGGRSNIVNHLVDKGADINIQDTHFGTALHIAAREGQEITVKCLVKKGADINIKDNNGRTPLQVADKSGCEKIAKFLREVSAAYRPEHKKETPLHIAVRQGDVNTVKTLLGQGADVNIKDKEGMTPLHIAAKDGPLEIVKCLVERAAINIKDDNGRSPLHIAAREGQKVIMEVLVGEGADVSMKDNDDRTPLHLAAEKVRCDIMEYLVQNGADINIKDNEGWTPLHMVARGGYENTVEFIVKQGADINILDKKRQTPLHIASRKGYVKTVERLVKLGADLSIKDDNGMVPLHVAAEAGRHKIVGFLFGAEVDINMKDDKGRTPLHIASKEGYQCTTECLVAKGADINMKDDEGMTPLEVANERGHVKIVKFLRGDEEEETSE